MYIKVSVDNASLNNQSTEKQLTQQDDHCVLVLRRYLQHTHIV